MIWRMKSGGALTVFARQSALTGATRALEWFMVGPSCRRVRRKRGRSFVVGACSLVTQVVESLGGCTSPVPEEHAWFVNRQHNQSNGRRIR